MLLLLKNCCKYSLFFYYLIIMALSTTLFLNISIDIQIDNFSDLFKPAGPENVGPAVAKIRTNPVKRK